MRNFFAGLCLGAAIFTSFGYLWAFKALTKTYEIRLEQKEILISHYQNHWTPIRETSVRVRGK